MPVTHGVTGSSPVRTANLVTLCKSGIYRELFFYLFFKLGADNQSITFLVLFFLWYFDHILVVKSSLKIMICRFSDTSKVCMFVSVKNKLL